MRRLMKKHNDLWKKKSPASKRKYSMVARASISKKVEELDRHRRQMVECMLEARRKVAEEAAARPPLTLRSSRLDQTSLQLFSELQGSPDYARGLVEDMRAKARTPPPRMTPILLEALDEQDVHVELDARLGRHGFFQGGRGSHVQMNWTGGRPGATTAAVVGGDGGGPDRRQGQATEQRMAASLATLGLRLAKYARGKVCVRVGWQVWWAIMGVV